MLALLPWPEGHQSNVDQLMQVIVSHPDFAILHSTGTGLMLFTRLRW